ncbi:DUF2306 domain-containing protein [Mucilaginibacter sp. RS28]|uniref:DUF2306 domain-containing protein n=1 Tax=Mucilaginibacter straminoryzae TaxID=2932774 RepID=A0A9X1X1G0_9SPHI|nr:DUF2306 domain-containing protein [Mucilaginibacter straminoryzae]MCJ8209036.1 DUF2306 domain-containing protein [Mucilaginibacter straminoryzae]
MAILLRSQPFHKGRVVLTAIMTLIVISVIYFSELPLLNPKHPLRAHLDAIRWLIHPHVVFATIAFITGPFQFSSYLRKTNLKLHRVLGKLYVISIYLSVLFVFAILFHQMPLLPYAVRLTYATLFEAICWVITVTLGWISARRRHIQVHQLWIARSYAITTTFFMTRLLNPISAYANLSADDFAYIVFGITGMAFFVPDIMLQWKAFFGSRKIKTT